MNFFSETKLEFRGGIKYSQGKIVFSCSYKLCLKYALLTKHRNMYTIMHKKKQNYCLGQWISTVLFVSRTTTEIVPPKFSIFPTKYLEHIFSYFHFFRGYSILVFCSFKKIST